MSKKSSRKHSRKPMLFAPWNYKILALGLLLVVVGFTAMYLENEIHGVVSLYISPLLIMGGYISVIFAIMKHDKNQAVNSEQGS